MARVWIFLGHTSKKNLDEKKCPWSVGWLDPDGKRKSKRMGSRSMAKQFARKLEGQLASGTYESEAKKQWTEFHEEYTLKKLPAMSSENQISANIARAHFQRLVKPALVSRIKTAHVDAFVAKRRGEQGAKLRSTVAKPRES